MRKGNCYAASEALYHILGGKKAGWTPQVMRLKGGDTHWFLRHKSGMVLDPSQLQFEKPLDPMNYLMAKGCGFLTKKPSKRARALMEKLTYAD